MRLTIVSMSSRAVWSERPNAAKKEAGDQAAKPAASSQRHRPRDMARHVDLGQTPALDFATIGRCMLEPMKATATGTVRWHDVSLAAGSFLAITYVLCVAYDLAFGQRMFESWQKLLPGFTGVAEACA